MDKIKMCIDERKNLTIFTVTGAVTSYDIIKQVEKYYTGKITLFTIWDVSKANLSGISDEDLQRVADCGLKYSTARRGGKAAFVAPEDFSFGISRVFGTISEMRSMPIKIGSFRNFGDAKKWLGID